MNKKQYYLNISTAGVRSNVITTSIEDSEMNIKDVVNRVFDTVNGYGFYYSFKECILKDGKEFCTEEVTLPFNFIDPTSIEECSINKGMYKVTIRNSWAVYYSQENDNIIFSSDEAQKNFEGDIPLKVIRY